MSMWSRIKSMLGGAVALRTVPSAATLPCPDDDNAFYVSGSTTVTSLYTPSWIRNRMVTIIGAASASVTFTNTNTLTTAGQMYLQGSDVVLNESDVLTLFCQNDGTWIMLGNIG